MTQPPDSRNLYIAIALCLAILLGWEFFIMRPRMEAERARQQAAVEAQKKAQPANPGTAAPNAATPTGVQPPTSGAPALPQSVALPRAAVIAASGARVLFDNKRVDGSLALTGARIDDLQMKDFHETVDPKSPEIVLFSPMQAKHAYFAEFGWAQAAGTTLKVPDAQTVWSKSQGEKLSPGNPVVLTFDNGAGLTFTRTISLDQDYMFTVKDKVTNTSGTPVALFPYAQVLRHGTPGYAPNWILHEGMVGVLNSTLSESTYDDLKETPEVKQDSTGGWLGITDKYWMAAIVPPQTEKFAARYSAIAQGGDHLFQADYLLGQRSIAPGASAEVEHRLFAGAKITSLISAYETKLGIERFDMAIDWGWFAFLTKPIFWLVDWLNKQFGNFGVAILLLTVIIKLIFFPLANRSYEAMSKMKKVQPEIQQLQERFKEDRAKLQQEMLGLYQREKISPLMGCLPIVIQIPVFFALYKVLFVTLEMRHAPFFGWVQDLAAPDPTSLFNLFGLLPFAVPVMLQIGIWPLLMGVTMWMQTQMNPPAQDPTQQMLLNWMPIIFTFMLASFPAGLVIYWAWNNVLSILQQYVIMRRMGTPIEVIDNFKWPAWITRALNRRTDG